MATYYKYQNPSEIGAAPTLDWGTVVENVNETLQRQEQQRFENRENDKKITNDILTKVNEVSKTSDPNANALITNMTYEAKQNIYELYKKLQRGEISRSDYNILNQNTQSSIAQLNQFTKTYGADYDKYLKDVQEGKTSAYADFMQKWKGGFQNFKYKKLVHNPNDGRLYVAELDDKGNVVDSPLGLVPMSALAEVKNFDDKKIDVLAETNRYTAQLKPFIELVRDGRIETREQLENFAEFDKFAKNVLEDVAKNNKGYASILTDTDGTYFITGNPDSIGKEIGIKYDGANGFDPIITDAAKEDALKVIKRYLIAQTGVKETGMERFAPQRAAAEKPEKIKEKSFSGKPAILNAPGTKQAIGMAFNVSNVIVPEAPGVNNNLKSVGFDYKTGKITMKGFTTVGKESEGLKVEGMPETYTSGANVVKKIDWGKKTKSGKNTGLLNEDENGAQMEVLAQYVKIPGTQQNFNSLDEIRQYFRSLGGGAQTKAQTPSKTTIKKSDIPKKAKESGYSVEEYTNLLKQKGIKIE